MFTLDQVVPWGRSFDALREAGFAVTIEPVGYEFQRGAGAMLRVRRQA